MNSGTTANQSGLHFEKAVSEIICETANIDPTHRVLSFKDRTGNRKKYADNQIEKGKFILVKNKPLLVADTGSQLGKTEFTIEGKIAEVRIECINQQVPGSVTRRHEHTYNIMLRAPERYRIIVLDGTEALKHLPKIKSWKKEKYSFGSAGETLDLDFKGLHILSFEEFKTYLPKLITKL